MKSRHTVALAALFAASIAFAQTGKPYQSTFHDYRPYADATPGDWRAVNQAVTAQAGGIHDHGPAKNAAGGHDHGSTPARGASAAHNHGAAGGDSHQGHGMHKGMDPDAMKRMHGKHMQGNPDAARGGHEGHGTMEKKP